MHSSLLHRFKDRFSLFWLRVFFALTSIAPGLVRAMRPMFVRLAFAFSPKIRRNTRANALRLGVDPQSQTAFGLAVVGSFYDFVYDIGRGMGCTRAQLNDRVAAVDGADCVSCSPRFASRRDSVDRTYGFL